MVKRKFKIITTCPSGQYANRSPICQVCILDKAVLVGRFRSFSEKTVPHYGLNPLLAKRRFTRLTNAFSKKVENLEAAVALYFMHYNFCRIHQTLRVTPAMEASIADRVWTLEEIVGLLP